MFRNILIAGVTAAVLAGCGQAVNDARLTVARQELRAECFGNDTYSCRSKTIDFNIMVLQLTPFKNDADKAQVVQLFGEKGWELYEKVVDDFVEEGEETLDDIRPNIFARWFFGDSQPFSPKGYILEFSPQDMAKAGQDIQRRFFIRAKKEGLKPTEEAMKSMEATYPENDGQSASQSPAPSVALSSPAPQEITEVDPALTRAITDYTAGLDKDGGNENIDLRKVVRLDLNNDGTPDAAVIYTIEGVGGAQTGYAYLTSFFQQNGTWRAVGDEVQIEGSIQTLALAKPGAILVSTLTAGPDDPDCCPSVVAQQQFVWNEEKFVDLPVIR